MANNILLDTSFLIALVDSRDKLHAKAHVYHEWFYREKTTLYVSTIALSEYCVKNTASDLVHGLPSGLPAELPSNVFEYLFFNYRDAVVAGGLYAEHSTKEENKNCLKDDFKIIAQAQNHNVDYFVTGDSKLVRRMNAIPLGFSFMDINNPISDYTGEIPFED